MGGEKMGGKIIGLIWAILICLLISICTSCKSVRYVTVPYAVHDTVKATTYAVDTIYNRDSIYVNGQTVYKEKWRFRIQIRRDTIYQHKVDSISVPVYLNTTTKIGVPWYNKIFIHIGRISLIAILIFLAVYLIRLYLRRKI